MNTLRIATSVCFAGAVFVAASASAQAPAAKAPPAAAAAAKAGAAPLHPQAPCITQIRNERAGFQRAMEQGMKSGRIDKKEHASLEKTHGELMAMEKKAAEDHKLSAAECKAIHAKIVEEHKKLQMAMATPAKK